MMKPFLRGVIQGVALFILGSAAVHLWCFGRILSFDEREFIDRWRAMKSPQTILVGEEKLPKGHLAGYMISASGLVVSVPDDGDVRAGEVAQRMLETARSIKVER